MIVDATGSHEKILVEFMEAALREAHRVLTPRGRMLVTEPIHGSGALGQTLRLYLDEGMQKQHAVKAINAVIEKAFALRAHTQISIHYGFDDFEDFYAGHLMSRPEAAGDAALKRDMRQRFERCPRNSEGAVVVDHAASVWHLLKA